MPAQAADDISMRIAALLGSSYLTDCFVVDRTAAWLHGAPMALAPNDHLRAAAGRDVQARGSTDGLRNKLARSGERTVLATGPDGGRRASA